MAPTREPPKLAILRPGPRPRWKAPLVGSVFAHALLLFVTSYDFSCAGIRDPELAAGGPGARGGGGGGGGEFIGYMALPAYQPPEPEAQSQQRDVPPEEMVIALPVPQIAMVEQSQLATQERQRINLADILGRGDGTGGGAGRGTGTGGGEGTGEGTGIGSARGSGTGGEGGDIFPPGLRYAVLPPPDAPSGVKGRMHVVRFLIRADGTVARVEVTPRIRDGGYRQRFLEVMRTFRFTPATTRDGTPIEAVYEIEVTP